MTWNPKKSLLSLGINLRFPNEFERKIHPVAGGIVVAELAIREYEKDAVEGPANISADAHKIVDTARAAILAASQANGVASQLLVRHRTAGGELRSAVDKIDTAVLDELRGTENAIQAVPGIISQMVKNIGGFSNLSKSLPIAPLPVPALDGKPASRGRPDESRMNLANALQKLQQDTAVLEILTTRIIAIATAIDQKKSMESLKACKVEGVNADIVAAPLEVPFTAGVAGRKLILVSGGNGNYEANFLESPATGLTVSIPPRSSGVIEVVATDQTVPDTYHVMIEDATRQSTQIVTVTVKAAPAPVPKELREHPEKKQKPKSPSTPIQ